MFKVRKFAEAEDGAITVDWVVLSAIIIGLAVAIVGTIKTNSVMLGGRIGDFVNNQTVSN